MPTPCRACADVLGNRLEGERVVDESVGADAWSALAGAELETLSNEMLLIVIPSVMETISITMPPYERSPRRATGTRECIHERDPDDGIRRSATTCLSGQIVSIVLHGSYDCRSRCGGHRSGHADPGVRHQPVSVSHLARGCGGDGSAVYRVRLVRRRVADRVNRRTVILCAQAVAALALASIPAAQALGVLTAWHSVGVSMCIGTCFVWFDAAAFGALPALVGRQRIPAANSALWTSSTLIDVVFPAIAGVLVASIGPAYALGADALAYVLAGLAMARSEPRFRLLLRRRRSREPELRVTYARASASSGGRRFCEP